MFLFKIAIAEKKDFPPVLVSLGCSCEVAQQIRLSGKRERAFPFDWLLTTHFEKFISIFENDFNFFLDINYFSNKHFVLNNYYNIEFRHDFYDMIDQDFDEFFPFFKEKYERRIERFRKLSLYPGKVYFIRSAYPPHYPQNQAILTEECLLINKIHAENLRNALVKFFPNLNFELIIINYDNFYSEKILDKEKVIEFKIGSNINFSDVIKTLVY